LVDFVMESVADVVADASPSEQSGGIDQKFRAIDARCVTDRVEDCEALLGWGDAADRSGVSASWNAGSGHGVVGVGKGVPVSRNPAGGELGDADEDVVPDAPADALDAEGLTNRLYYTVEVYRLLDLGYDSDDPPDVDAGRAPGIRLGRSPTTRNVGAGRPLSVEAHVELDRGGRARSRHDETRRKS
jgi:hypothetical protein